MKNVSFITLQYRYLVFFFLFFYQVRLAMWLGFFPVSVKKQQTNGQRQLMSDISGWTSAVKC